MFSREYSRFLSTTRFIYSLYIDTAKAVCSQIALQSPIFTYGRQVSMAANIDSYVQDQWDCLINTFTPDHIRALSDKKDYVLGFGPSNKSFCYLVEFELRSLGDIRGSNASKFGLWYGTFGKDKTKRFRATKKSYGADPDVAFESIKIALADLIEESKKLSSFKELPSSLNGLFKYKVMYLYNPSMMLPIFQIRDLHHFEKKLGLSRSVSFEDAQKQLLRYKVEEFSGMSNHDFMLYLYGQFGRSKSKEEEIAEANDGLDAELNRKISEMEDLQGEYQTHPVQKGKAKRVNDIWVYPRDPKMAARALALAKHRCECDNGHYCFPRKKDGKPYTEVHHLIPLSFYDAFAVSLDVPENIVSLCSSCHNEIHYGMNSADLIKKLFQLRKDELAQAGIVITLEDLLKYYRIKN